MSAVRQHLVDLYAKLPTIEPSACPFCAGTNPEIVPDGIAVLCPDCGAVGPNAFSERTAIALWNLRRPAFHDEVTA